MFVNTLGKAKDSIWNIWESHLNLFNQRESVSCIEVSKTEKKMVNLGNFERTASLSVRFHLGTLHGYFFH